MKHLPFVAILIFFQLTLQAQSEAEIRSDGIVVPKITNAQRPSPATLGHLVYNTDQDRFEYYNGANWIPVSTSSGNPNEIENAAGNSFARIEESGNFDYLQVGLNGNVRFNLTQNSNHIPLMYINDFADNVLMGRDPGAALDNQGLENIAIGKEALKNAITTDHNIAIGRNTLNGINIGQNTTLFGSNNVALGDQAMAQCTNVAFGTTALGFEAGLTGGSNSVFIGNKAGKNPGSLQTAAALFIANDEGKPLIYGEFNNNFVEVDGQLQATLSGTTSAPSYVGVLESIGSQRPSLLFSVGGNQSFSGMAMEYDSRSTMQEAQLNLRNDLNNVFFSVIEDGDIELYGDIDRPGGELDLRAGGTHGITIETNGEVGIGTTNPQDELHVIGNARISALGGSGQVDLQANNLGQFVKVISDRRLKKNIATIQNALEKVTAMRGVSYEWKDQENPNKTLGVIAQEVKEIVPDVVTKNGEYYGVNYSEFPALFIEAIKEQQAIINSLQIELEKRDQQLNSVFDRLAQLENLFSSNH